MKSEYQWTSNVNSVNLECINICQMQSIRQQLNLDWKCLLTFLIIFFSRVNHFYCILKLLNTRNIIWRCSSYISRVYLTILNFICFRLFGTTGYCAACNKVIPAFEMVMRARTNVYHLECFACQQCNHR